MSALALWESTLPSDCLRESAFPLSVADCGAVECPRLRRARRYAVSRQSRDVAPYGFALIVINRGSRREQAPPLRVCANNAATLAFPKAGCPRLRRARRYAALRQSREGGPSKTVDEDVGSRFMGKCFGVRLFEGECFPVIGRGFRRHQGGRPTIGSSRASQ